MKSWIAAGFALAISLSAVAKEPIPTVFTTYANAKIVIESDGRVSDIKFVGPKLGATFESSLSAKIREPGLFQTGLLNGKPAQTHSMLQLQLRAESDVKNKQTVFSLYNIVVSTRYLPDSHNYVIYPKRMLQRGREAQVLVHISYDANGAVIDAHVDETQSKVHADFARSALRYTRNLKFFVETVGGVKQGGSAFVPVSYKIVGNDDVLANYEFRLPSGERLQMQPGEPVPDVTSTKMQASLTKPFVPQALTDG